MKDKIRAFLYGRYGNDGLNACLLWLAILVLIIDRFVPRIPLYILAWGIWGIAIYRTFSRNIYARHQEYQTFLRLTAPLRHRVLAWIGQYKDRTHKYYVCPKCSQIVRVPKGRGKIVVTCPKCRHHFDRRS